MAKMVVARANPAPVVSGAASIGFKIGSISGAITMGSKIGSTLIKIISPAAHGYAQLGLWYCVLAANRLKQRAHHNFPQANAPAAVYADNRRPSRRFRALVLRLNCSRFAR